MARLSEFADLDSALEHILMGIFILDREGNYLYVNEQYCQSIGRPPEFYREMSIPRLKKMGYLSSSVWEQVLREQRTVISVVSVTDQGVTTPYLTVGTPQFDEHGEIRQIVCRQESVKRLNELLQHGSRNRYQVSRDGTGAPAVQEQIIAESPQMKQLLSTLLAVSRTDAAILVTGPSGSGKEVLSRMIHENSARREGAMVTINCAAIPESLFESEMFGYEKGAFTGAAAGGKKGLIESADGGTLFLDEINSMPLSFQIKLLRVLETKQVTRLGAVAAQKVDFRLVCASNEDLHALVEQQRFRSDLFYRINVISVSIPPLSERKQDIIPLAMHFLRLFSEKYNYIKTLSERAEERLKAYTWPGNVRELRNVIERAVIMSSPQQWEIDEIPLESPSGAQRVEPMARKSGAGWTGGGYQGQSLKAYMDACERQLFEKLVGENRSPREIARLLDINLSSVYRKLRQHQMNYGSGLGRAVSAM